MLGFAFSSCSTISIMRYKGWRSSNGERLIGNSGIFSSKEVGQEYLSRRMAWEQVRMWKIQFHWLRHDMRKKTQSKRWNIVLVLEKKIIFTVFFSLQMIMNTCSFTMNMNWQRYYSFNISTILVEFIYIHTYMCTLVFILFSFIIIVVKL